MIVIFIFYEAFNFATSASQLLVVCVQKIVPPWLTAGLAEAMPAGPLGEFLEHCAAAPQRLQPQPKLQPLITTSTWP